MASFDEVKAIFPAMLTTFKADKAEGVNTTFLFDLSGDNGGKYWLKVENGQATYGEGDVEGSVVVKATADDFHNIATGGMAAMSAFMMGKIKVSDMGMGMKLMQIFNLGG